ncbi:MAG: hypothetical protein HQL70_03395 [Magnetococcales bacterium]|nr:hypothetical protein [Magnetococcales bacterium]
MGLRLIKIFVIIGGILVVVGSVVVLAKVYSKLPEVGGTSELENKNLDTQIILPAGATPVSLSPHGSSGVAVLVKFASGGGELLMINKKGELFRRVHLAAKTGN